MFRFTGGIDDVTLTVNFRTEMDDSSSDSSIGPGVKGRAGPPPLPVSAPPKPRSRTQSPSNDSYYLPSYHGDDSADEASEIIDEDDGAMPLPSKLREKARAKSADRELRHKSRERELRAKSADRDSDFSEMSLSSMLQGRPRKAVTSLESIPDSGVESATHDLGNLRVKVRESKGHGTVGKSSLSSYELVLDTRLTKINHA